MMQWVLGVLIALATLLPNMASQGTDVGSPIIRNFTPDDYQAHFQNWSILQDRRGYMYVGNGNCILEFDGRNWNRIATPDNAMVRSLAMDEKGTVWVGANGNLGYLASDSLGKTLFVSLLDQVNPEDRSFNDVWKTFSTSHGTYFLTKDRVFRVHAGKIDAIDADLMPKFGFAIDDEVFLVLKNLGIGWLRENAIVPLPHSQPLLASATATLHLMPYRRHQFFVIDSNGEFVVYDLRPFLDPEKRTFDFSRKSNPRDILHPFRTEVTPYLPASSARFYFGIQVSDDLFALSTARNGILFMDAQGQLVRIINKKSGLVDNAVWQLCLDREQNLWAATNTGISYIQSHSPISFFNATNQLDGYITSAIRFRDKVYAGSFNGAMALEEHKLQFKNDAISFSPVYPGVRESWQFLEFDHFLLIGTNPKALLIDDRFKVKAYATDYIYSLGSSPKFPNTVFIGLMDGLAVFHIHRQGNGDIELEYDNTIFKDFTDPIRKIVADENGDLWLSTYASGLMHLKFHSHALGDYRIERYGREDGLPQLDWNYAHIIAGHLLVGTQQGIYEGIRPLSGNGRARFVPDKTIGSFFSQPAIAVQSIMPAGNNRWMIQSYGGFGYVVKNDDGSYVWEKAAFNPMPLTEDYSSLDTRGILWVPTPKGLYRFDPSIKKSLQTPFPAVIGSVIAGKDTLIFAGNHYDPNSGQGNVFRRWIMNQSVKTIPRIPFRLNALTFHYSALFYEYDKALRFQFMLNGFDPKWSDWTPQSYKEYTNLPAGSYTFRVKARNIYETESDIASFSFSIAPPWYRTLPAYIGFAVAGFLFLGGIIRIYTFRLHREKTRLQTLVDMRTKELKEISLTDPLTGLRNRRYIAEILSTDITAFIKQKKYAQKTVNRRKVPDQKRLVFGIYILDIDHFKSINDAYGHDAGDKLLQQLSRILRDSVRETDDVMRIGGEEFMVVLKNSTPDYLLPFAERLKTKIDETTFDLDNGIKEKRTCSIGYTTFPFYEDAISLISFDHTVTIADHALYYAKTHGRDLAVYIGGTDKKPVGIEGVRQICSSLDYAIDNDYFFIQN